MTSAMPPQIDAGRPLMKCHQPQTAARDRSINLKLTAATTARTIRSPAVGGRSRNRGLRPVPDS
jgi:hypothetical protein